MGNVTEQRVFRACDEAARAGVKITLDYLREQLDGGSYSTLGKYRKKWLASRKDNGVPSIDTASVPAQLEQLWLQAQLQAEDRVKEEREEFHREAERLEARHASDQEQLAEERKQREALEARWSALYERLQDHEAHIEAFSQSLGVHFQRVNSVLDLHSGHLDASSEAQQALEQAIRDHMDQLSVTLSEVTPLPGLVRAMAQDFNKQFDSLAGHIDGSLGKYAESVDGLKQGLGRVTAAQSSLAQDVGESVGSLKNHVDEQLDRRIGALQEDLRRVAAAQSALPDTLLQAIGKITRAPGRYALKHPGRAGRSAQRRSRNAPR